MNLRIEALKARETLTHRIKYLMADVATQETSVIAMYITTQVVLPSCALE